MDFQTLKQELDNDQLRNFYVFTGEEKLIMQRYIKRIDSNAKTFPSFKSIAIKLQNVGLFNVEQTFVIHDDKEVMEMDLKELVRKIGSNTLILVYDKLDERTKFAKAVKAFHVEFKKFTEDQLVGYVQKLLPETTDENAMLLARYCGNDVARIENECDKIKHLIMDLPPWDDADKSLVTDEDLNQEATREDIEELIVPPLEDRIFEMIDSIMKRNHTRSFKLYHDLIEMKESPIKIVSLLYTKFKQVFLVQTMQSNSNQELSGKTGMTFFQVDMARKLVGHYESSTLLLIMQMIQKAEVAMKTGQIDIEVGMDNLLVDILE